MGIRYISFCSGGKDSVAMTELLIIKKMRLDEIVFVEVEKEFPQEKQHRDLLIKRWRALGYNCVVIKSEDTFDWWFYGSLTRGKKKGMLRGFPLTVYSCYWTREAKVKVIEKYLKTMKEPSISYVGYTINEKSNKRKAIKERYLAGEKSDKIYPLIDWSMTEEDCRRFCQENDILNPLYNYFNRLGCYLCPKQNKASLISLKENFPDQWKELIEYCKSTESENFVSPGQFNVQFSMEDLCAL